ncbi:hypothetical protein OPT61_g5455 [Boeremia exigua]|uniref:Uncharacterized protein n=1 Tax=Boeremia exigua TaxID=749465 RepID=A0ACC2IAA6_9PLEO|nr:hypothetical protein OPT61_g5455 [Boeremia exigua]
MPKRPNFCVFASSSASALPIYPALRVDLGTEEAALCALDDLLVYALWGVVHDDCAGLVVDLGVDTCVADQVDDPLLTLVLRQAEACREVPGHVSESVGRSSGRYALDVDALVDLAVALGDEMPGGVDKGVGGGEQEEVVLENLLGLAELLLCLLKVKVDVQGGP